MLAYSAETQVCYRSYIIAANETLLPSSTKLLRAPSKRKLKSQLKQKRKLIQDSEQEQLIDKMVELIPTVMKTLQL